MLVCPGCLRPIDEILDNGCGSQRCPELVDMSVELFNTQLAERQRIDDLIKGVCKPPVYETGEKLTDHAGSNPVKRIGTAKGKDFK